MHTDISPDGIIWLSMICVTEVKRIILAMDRDSDGQHPALLWRFRDYDIVLKYLNVLIYLLTHSVLRGSF